MRTDASGVPSTRRVGRPSVQAERRQQIVTAFIEHVANMGLEHVSLDEVAKTAGVKRAALRHFVGNREQLTTAAIVEITRVALVNLDTPMTLAELTAMLFSQRRIENLSVVDRAWTELMPEAMRSAETRAVIKECYDQLLQLISNTLRQSYPDASRTRISETAYAIACMSEYNFTFQRIGYPRARCKALRQAALALAERLG